MTHRYVDLRVEPDIAPQIIDRELEMIAGHVRRIQQITAMMRKSKEDQQIEATERRES